MSAVIMAPIEIHARQLDAEEPKAQAGDRIGWGQHDMGQRLADARRQYGNGQMVDGRAL